MRAALKPFPAVTSTAPLAPLTCVGVVLLVVLPRPSSPVVLSPHAQTVFEPGLAMGAVIASECALPAPTVIAFDRPAIVIGARRTMVVPSPSWLELLSPQAATVPSGWTAR